MTDVETRDTLVTAIYELDVFGPLGGRGRSVEIYLPPLASVAALGAPLVVYTQPRLVDVISRSLEEQSTPFIVVPRELEFVPRFEQIQELRERLKVAEGGTRDRCHALCFSKLPWVVEQIDANPFESERFYWIDAGLPHPGLFPRQYMPDDWRSRCALFTPRVLDALDRGEPKSADDGEGEHAPDLVMLGQPLLGSMLHNVDIAVLADFIGPGAPTPTTHIVGGLFGGTPRALRALYVEYDEVLGRMLEHDLLGTEENVLTVLYHRSPARVKLHQFTTWYHEDTGWVDLGDEDVAFYRIFETLDRLGTDMQPAEPEWYPKTTGDLDWSEADGAFMLTSPADDRVHVLNNIGVLLLELSNGNHSVPEMIEIVQEAFQLNDPPLEEVHGFLDRARRAGLVS